MCSQLSRKELSRSESSSSLSIVLCVETDLAQLFHPSSAGASKDEEEPWSSRSLCLEKLWGHWFGLFFASTSMKAALTAHAHSLLLCFCNNVRSRLWIWVPSYWFLHALLLGSGKREGGLLFSWVYCAWRYMGSFGSKKGFYCWILSLPHNNGNIRNSLQSLQILL